MVGLGNFQVQEETDYSGRDIPSLKEIILIYIRKIGEISCQEFTEGYWEEKPVKTSGGVIFSKTYKPDVRAEFCNAMDFLVWIVYPLSDKEFKDSVAKAKWFIEEDEKDWDKKIKKRKEIFKEMNIMFDRYNFFDTQRGRTERSK